MIDYVPRPVLSQQFIDLLYLQNRLVSRIVDKLPTDMMKEAPTLDSDRVDPTTLWDYATQLGLPNALLTNMSYARKHGGGGILVMLEDGMDPSEEVDLRRITRVRGFFPLNRWELPVVKWSQRPGTTWYGMRFNDPEMYTAAPTSGAAETVSGQWHRSRVIPQLFLPNVSRRETEYNGYTGWTPGVIEGVFVELMARVGGAARTGDLMRSFGYDMLKWPGLRQMLSAQNGGALVRRITDFIIACRDLTTGQGVGLITVDSDADIKPLQRNVSGVSDLVNAQREFLLDVTEYPAVELYGRTNTGLGSGDAEGERQGYGSTVDGGRTTWLWPAMRQGLIYTMASRSGPTGGEVDLAIKGVWPDYYSPSPEKQADARKKNAEAREKDIVVGVITPREARMSDPDVREQYPTAPLESQWGSGTQSPEPIDMEGGAEGGVGPEAAREDDAPEDLKTEVFYRTHYGLKRAALRRLARENDIQPYRAYGGGQRSYSLSAVLKAFRMKGE